MLSGSTDGPSDWNGQHHDCNSYQGTISVRVEDQEKILRAEEVSPSLNGNEALMQDPGGYCTEHPSGSLRDEVSDEYPPHGVGGTCHGIRKCPRAVARQH